MILHFQLFCFFTDPQVYIESKLTLMSSQMAESKRLANEIDKEASEELLKLETDLAEKTKKDMEKLKQNMCSQLMQNHGRFYLRCRTWGILGEGG